MEIDVTILFKVISVNLICKIFLFSLYNSFMSLNEGILMQNKNYQIIF